MCREDKSTEINHTKKELKPKVIFFTVWYWLIYCFKTAYIYTSPPFKITEYYDLHFISQATSPNFLSWTRGVVASWVRSLPCRTRKVGRNTFSAGKVGRWLVSWSDEAEETLLFVSLYFFGKSSSSSSTVPAFFLRQMKPSGWFRKFREKGREVFQSFIYLQPIPDN